MRELASCTKRAAEQVAEQVQYAVATVRQQVLLAACCASRALQVRQLVAYIQRQAGQGAERLQRCCEHVQDPNLQVRELATYMQRQAEQGAERLQYEVATVTRLQPVSMGDRSASLTHSDESPQCRAASSRSLIRCTRCATTAAAL